MVGISLIFIFLLAHPGHDASNMDQAVRDQGISYCRQGVTDASTEAHQENCKLIREHYVDAEFGSPQVNGEGAVTRFPLAQFIEQDKAINFASETNPLYQDLFYRACNLGAQPMSFGRSLLPYCRTFCGQHVRDMNCPQNCRQAAMEMATRSRDLHLAYHEANQNCIQEIQNGSGTVSPNMRR